MRDDHHMIKSYGVCSCDVIMLTKRIHTLYSLHIRTSSETMKVTVKYNDSISKIKEQIERERGIPYSQQCLTCNDMELCDDQRSVVQYDLNDQCNIELTLIHDPGQCAIDDALVDILQDNDLYDDLYII